MISNTGSSFTAYGWLLCIWILLVPFQYGYHISVLNQIQAVLTCKQANVSAGFLNLPTCVQMNDFSFSLVTSLFTIGGLSGSLIGSNVIERYGLKGGARLSALLVAFGAASMGISGGIFVLGFGRYVFDTSCASGQNKYRFVIGIGSGLGLCISPIYIAEVAPSKISGRVGQLLLVFFGRIFDSICRRTNPASDSSRYFPHSTDWAEFCHPVFMASCLFHLFCAWYAAMDGEQPCG